MANALPAVPWCIFGVFEPAALILAFVVTAALPKYYVSSQSKFASPRSLLPSENILLYQLSNLFLLVAVISLYVLNSTNDVKVARAFLTALWWGDLGHLGVTVWCMGDSMLNIKMWNLVNWGNVAVPTFLFTARLLCFLGVLGGDVNAKD